MGMLDDIAERARANDRKKSGTTPVSIPMQFAPSVPIPDSVARPNPNFDQWVQNQPTTPETMAQDIINRFGEDYVASKMEEEQAVAAATAGAGGGSGGSGYDLEGQLKQIREQYAAHQADLDRQKAQSLDSLLQYGDKAKADIGKQRADYGTQAGAINQSIAGGYTNAQNAQAANADAARAELQRQGLNPESVMPSVAQGAGYLAQQGQAQQALGTRLQQVADQGFASQQATTDEVRHAGQTQLESNYASLKSKLDLTKLQAEASANESYQSSLRSSAGGGGGAGINENGLTAWQQAQMDFDYYKEGNAQSRRDEEDLPNGFDLSTLDPDSYAYQAAFQGTLKDAQEYIAANVDSQAITGDEGKLALQQLAQNYGSAKSSYRSGQAKAAQESRSTAIRDALLKTYKGR